MNPLSPSALLAQDGAALLSFLKDAEVDQGAAFAKWSDRLGLEAMDCSVDCVLLLQISIWHEFTDLQFPSDLTDSHTVVTRMNMVAKMIKLLKVRDVLEKNSHLRARTDRQQVGLFLRKEVAIAINDGSVSTRKISRWKDPTLDNGSLCRRDFKKQVDTSHTSTPNGLASQSVISPSPALPSEGESIQNNLLSRMPTEGSFPCVPEPRPITKLSLCQEKVFHRLSGDKTRPPKHGRAIPNESKKTYLQCTIIGFCRRQCVYVEPVGTCGRYENEARILIIDGTSTVRNSDGFSLLDLPVASDIRVHEVERVPPQFMGSVYYAPTWRVKSFALVDGTNSIIGSELLFVEELHPFSHTVTVSGRCFTGPHVVHMGNWPMPRLHTFLEGKIYQSEYATQATLQSGVLIYVTDTTPTSPNVLCRHCGSRVPGINYCHVAQLRPCTKKEKKQLRKDCHKNYGITLQEHVRQPRFNPDSRTCQICAARGLVPVKDHKKSKAKRSVRTNKERTEHNPSQVVRSESTSSESGDSGSLNNTQSTQLEVPATFPVKFEQAVNYSPPPVHVKPDPIRCKLCLTDIQPMDEVYYEVSCLESCRLSVHKKCLQLSLAEQGLRKKREYKDGVCLTEGCGAPLQDIHEYSINNTKSLYLKCDEKLRSRKNSAEGVDEKKKETKSKFKDRTVEPKPKPVYNDVPEETEKVGEVPTPPADVLPEVAASRPLVPPPKPNRPIPLPVDIENVVPLEKENSPLEEKYMVFEQPQKKVKPPKNKKVVLDLQIGFRRGQNQLNGDQPGVEFISGSPATSCSCQQCRQNGQNPFFSGH